MSLDILLHDFCTFRIFHTVSSKVMSKQLATIVEVMFLRDFESLFFDQQPMLILSLVLVFISFRALVDSYFID